MDRVSILTIIAAVSTAVFGIISAVLNHKLRDDGGKLTGWGMLSIGLLIASGITTLGLDLYDRQQERKAATKAQEQARDISEQAKRAADKATEAAEIGAKNTETTRTAANNAKEASERAQQAVKELDRVAHPLESIQFEFLRLTIPMTDAEFRGYKARLDEAIENFLKQLRPPSDNYTYINRDGEGHNYGGIWFYNGSFHAGRWTSSNVGVDDSHALFPSSDNEQEKLINQVLQVQWVDLAFYRTRIRSDDYDVVTAPTPLYWHSNPPPPSKHEPDLRIVEGREQQEWFLRRVVFHPIANREDSYQMVLNDWKPDRSSWKFWNRKFDSIPDFEGAQLIITLGPLFDDAKFQELRARMKLESIRLLINDNRIVDLKAADIKRRRSKGGHTFWECKIPADPFVPRQPSFER